MQETVVNEVRAQQLDMLARAKFIKPGNQVSETRWHLAPEEEIEEERPVVNKARVAKTAEYLAMGVDKNFIEVG